MILLAFFLGVQVLHGWQLRPGDGVCVVGPGQVLADVNPEEPEAADSLRHSPIDPSS